MEITRRVRAALEAWRLHPGIARAATVAVLDEDRDETLAQLAIGERKLSRDLTDSFADQPAPIHFGVRALSMLASCRVLCSLADSRNLEQLKNAFRDPEWQREPIDQSSAVCLAFLLEDPRLNEMLEVCRAKSAADRLLVATIQLLQKGDGRNVGLLFDDLAPSYRAEIEERPWEQKPISFLHIQLLAVLAMGVERGLIDLATVPSSIPYVPLRLLR